MITRFFQALRRRHTRNVTIRELSALSNWQLRDLGVTRGEIPSLVDAWRMEPRYCRPSS